MTTDGTFGDRLKRVRRAAGMTQAALAEKAGFSVSTIKALESGDRGARLPVDTLERLALALRVLPRELMGRDIIHEPRGGYRTTEIAVRGYIAAGVPRETYLVDLGMVLVPAFVEDQYPKAFALIVSGDSLSGDSIHDGDLLVVNPMADLQVGKLYIVQIEDRLCARHVFLEGDHVKLKAANDQYEDIKVADLELVGRVVWHMRRM